MIFNERNAAWLKRQFLWSSAESRLRAKTHTTQQIVEFRLLVIGIQLYANGNLNVNSEIRVYSNPSLLSS